MVYLFDENNRATVGGQWKAAEVAGVDLIEIWFARIAASAEGGSK